MTEYSPYRTIFDKNKYESIMSGEEVVPNDDESLIYSDTSLPETALLTMADLPPKKSKFGFKYSRQVKHSAGIILFRKSIPPAILMVQKRCTYEFTDFVLGKYNPQNKNNLYRLFNNMTFHEKMDILSGDFRYIWYKAFLEDVCENMDFNKVYSKYMSDNFQDGIIDKLYKPCINNNTFTKRMNSKYTVTLFKKYTEFISNKYFKSILMTVINNSNTAEPTWEIPKGRIEEGEFPMDCAMREIEEETNIKPRQYYLFSHEKPLMYSIEHPNVVWSTQYFFAMAKKDIPVSISFKNVDQVNEVSRVSWMTLEEIYNIDKSKNKTLHKFCKIVFTRFKKIRNKKYIKPLMA